MPDIRNLSTGQTPSQVIYDGKLIYELIKVQTLRDTDLFAISTTDSLTRSVSLKQIKNSFNNEYYSITDIDNLLDDIRRQIQNLSQDIFNLRTEVNEDISDLRSLINTTKNELENMIRTWIKYGKEIPTSLETGRLYIQWFD